jgi:glutaredoxin
MLSFTKSGKNCYFDDNKKKICYPTKCNAIYPISSGWTVYGLSWCPWRAKACELLTSKGISFYYYDIEQPPFNGKDNFKQIMASYLNGQKTTPAIFQNGKLIGGYTDLAYKFSK